MFKRFLIFSLLAITVLSGIYTPQPVVAQDATPAVEPTQVEEETATAITPTDLPTATSASQPTDSPNASEQPEASNAQSVQPLDDPVTITLTSNGSEGLVNVTYPVSVPLQASSNAWAGAGEWSNVDIDADIYVFSGTSCSDSNPTYIPLSGVNTTATSAFQPSAPGDYSLQVWWFPGPNLSNCLDVHVDAPVISLTSNSSQGPIDITYPASIPLEASSASWAGAGEWSNVDIDADIYVFPGTSCSSDNPTYIPLSGVDTTATSAFQPSAPGDYSLQVWWFPGPSLSNCLDVHVDPANFTLTANGSPTGTSVQVNEPVSLVATGPWSANSGNMNLWVYSNPVPADSCTGGTHVSTQGTSPTGNGTSSYTWTPTAPGSYYANIYWYPSGGSSAIYSNCVTITVSNPSVDLTANGSSTGTSVQVNEPVSFVATGPWSANSGEMNLWVYSNPDPADSCTGGVHLTTQGTSPTGNGTSSYTWTPTAPGNYYANIYWYPSGGSSAIYSNCVTITVSNPSVDLTANGSPTGTSVQVNEPVSLVATGPWSANSGEMNLWVYSNPVPANSCAGGTHVSTQGTSPNANGTSSYTWTPTAPGSYYANIYWYPSGGSSAIYSNCVTITVTMPELVLRVGGETEAYDTYIGSTIPLFATGGWTTNSAEVHYYVYGDTTCTTGTDVHDGLLTASPDGTATWDVLPWFPIGIYGVQATWNGQTSTCVKLTINPPSVSLKINGSSAATQEITNATRIDFDIVGPWEAGDTNLLLSDNPVCDDIAQPNVSTYFTSVDYHAAHMSLTITDGCVHKFNALWTPDAETIMGSNGITVTLVPPTILFTINGSSDDLTVAAGVPLTFQATGPWEDNGPIFLFWIMTCGDDHYSNGQSLLAADGSVYYQMPLTDLCVYDFYVIWAYSGAQNYQSNHITVTIEAPSIHLKVNGSEADQTAAVGSMVDFDISGNWPAGVTTLYLRESYDAACENAPHSASQYLFHQSGTVGYHTGNLQRQMGGDLCIRTFDAFWVVDGVAYYSNAVEMELVAPTITLTANGESTNLTVGVNELVDFEATGPWQAGDTGITYAIRIDPTPGSTCSGFDIANGAPVPAEDGNVHFSWVPTIPGVHAAFVTWVPFGSQIAYPSNCIEITVTDPQLALTANGKSEDLQVAVNTTVSFEATGPWLAGDPGITYAIRIDPTPGNICSGTDVATGAPVPTESGSATFTWKPALVGTYYAFVIWVPDGSQVGYPTNCITITVSDIPPVSPTATSTTSPAATATSTVSPTATSTATSSPTSTTEPTASATGTTEPTSSATATGTAAATATTAAVTSLPSTGDGPGSGSMWIGGAAIAAVAIMMAGAFVYRINRSRS
ncbi:MAG: hypothetical protein KC435_05740 [Thermomicrobiales bacterium]|nr:hypothetical protein [Thermomicrobiales bacterium]